MGKLKEMLKKIKFYAVKRGRHPGIYNTWEECKAQTDGFKKNRFKSFRTLAEAQAYLFDGHPPPDFTGPMDNYLEPKEPTKDDFKPVELNK